MSSAFTCLEARIGCGSCMLVFGCKIKPEKAVTVDSGFHRLAGYETGTPLCFG